jgi:hypothetical protein
MLVVVWAIVEATEALMLSGVLGGDVVAVTKDEEGEGFSEDVVELSVLERHRLPPPISAAFIATGCSL